MKLKSEFSRNILTLMTGTTIAQAIPIVISPILTRIYTPEDFGVFAFFISIVAIFSSISSARYEQAILLPISEEDAFHVFALGLILISFMSLFLFLFIVMFKGYIIQIFHTQELSLYIYFVPITVFFIGLFNLLSYFNNRKKLYTDMARASVIKAVVLAFVQIIIGFVKEGASGLITAQVLSQMFANIQLAKNIFIKKKFINIFNLKEIKRVAVEHNNFPKYQVPHTLLSTASSNLPVYIFTAFFSASITGFYSLAIRIIFAPMMIIAGSSAKVYNEHLSNLHKNQKDTYTFSVNFLKGLSLKILPFIVLVSIFSPELFAFIFGEAWREAGVYTRILSPWLFLNVIIASIAFIPSLVEKQKKAFQVSLVQFFLVLGVLGIGVTWGSVYITLLGFSVVNSFILLYNLIWFLDALKSSKKQKRML